MVKLTLNKKYMCPYCNRTHLSYNDAEECAEECLMNDILEPIEISSQIRHMCIYCEIEYNTYDNARECEEKHESKKDKLYEEYKQHMNQIELTKASKHPQQQTLQIQEM